MENAGDTKTLHLVGIGVTHSIAPSMHNLIAQSLGLPWTFHSTECETIEDVMQLARLPTVAGLVVTMPYKNTIMSKLDSLDELSITIGACNNVYHDPTDHNKLVGTNTDWLGIKGCLLEAGDESARPKAGPNSAAALLVGAGGASRAAVYALSAHLHSSTIYLLNRDDGEVEDLIRDTRKISPTPTIIHVKSVEQAEGLDTPYYVVGTVPDFPPQSEAEIAVATVLEYFLSRSTTKGVLLDMCFKPRRTRIIKLGERLGWPTVEGTHVIGYQIHRQWELWAGKEKLAQLDSDGAWKVLLQAAEESTAINF
ncbi:putative Shikimate dehydrogenase substrate binding N-terminal domain-containing protein [Seiridium unicorne]|uniref:Shikimate dehydrogenase substrate binding N-terminal domain-containing protein n=1 Tax=Seiridium unicorne TaxID=138068 RepID=A0ABR2UWI8_9PEZI